MTAGRGIIHSEDPLQSETVHSLQFWLNLPRSLKKTEPFFQDFKNNLEGNGYLGLEETFGSSNHVLWTFPIEGAEESKMTMRSEQSLKALLCAGETISENVVARGPFVMTSNEEIKEAIEYYYSGEFGDIR